MMKALEDIIKQRNAHQREIDRAKRKIEEYKESIQIHLDIIQEKEELIEQYDRIIELAQSSSSENKLSDLV